MSGINLYNRNLDAFVQFAQNSIDSTDKNSRKQAAVSRIVSEAGKPLEIEEATDDSRYSIRFSQRLKDKNNEARDAFIDALIEQFGSYEGIPESVKSKMKETDYGFTGEGHHATSGKPLSAERIHEVDQAIRKEAEAHPGKYAGISMFATLKDAMKDKNPDKQEYINKLATCVVNLFKGLNIDGNTKIPLAGNQDESRSLDEVFQCFLTRPYADNRQAGIAMLASVFSTLSKQLREKCNDYSVDSQEMTESLMQHGTARTAFKEFEDRITTFLEDKSVIMSLESEDKSTFPPLEIDIDSIFASLEKINNQNGQTEDQKKAEMRTMLRDVITQIQDIPYAQRDSDIDNMLAPFSFDKTNRFSSQVKFVYVLNKLYTRLDATLKRLKNPPFGLPTMYKRLNQEKLQQYLDVFRNKLEEYIQRGGESLRNRLKDFAAEYVNDELNNENWWNDNETDFKDINEAWKDLDKKIKQENGNQAEETAIKTRLETLAKEIEEESQNSTSVADSKTLSKITSAFCLLPELTPFNNPYYKDLLTGYKPCKEGKMDLEKIFTILHQYDSGITEILINGEANIADDYKLMPNGWSTSFLKNLKLFRQTVFPHNEFSKGVIDKLNDVVIDKTSMLPDIKHVYIKKLLMKFVQDLFKEQQLDEQEFDAITAQIMKGSDKKVEKYDAMNKLFEIMNRYEKQLTDPHEKYMYKIKRGEFLRQSQKQGIAFKPDIYSSKIEGELMTRRFSRYANTGQDAVRVFLENHFKNTFKEANSIDNGEARKAALEAMGTIAKGLASGNRNDFYDAKNNLKQCFENCIAQMNDETKKASEKYAQKVFDAFLKSLVF